MTSRFNSTAVQSTLTTWGWAMSDTNDMPIVGWIHRTALSIVRGGTPANIYPTKGRSAYSYQLVILEDAQAAIATKDAEIAELWQSWQAATAVATAVERERCAVQAEKATKNNRVIVASIDGVPTSACFIATAIRQGGAK